MEVRVHFTCWYYIRFLFWYCKNRRS